MFIDQYDDTENEFLKKIADAGIILKKKEDIHELPDKDFAVIIVKKRPHRKYPICDKESTILSMLYFLKNMGELPDPIREAAGSRLKEAATKFNLSIPSKLEQFDVGTDDYIIKKSDLVKEASVSDDMFGLVYEKDGEKIRKFPMPDEHHVKKAEMYVDEAPDEYRDELRANIKKKKDEFDMLENKELNPNLKRDMSYRIKEIPGEKKKPYMNLTDKLEDGQVSPKEAIKVIEKLDKENGISPRKLTAQETIFDMPKKRKVANDFTSLFEKEKTADIHDDIRGVLNDDEMRSSLEIKLKENFDKGMVEDLLSDSETIFESLPDPHKGIIKRIVGEVKTGG